MFLFRYYQPEAYVPRSMPDEKDAQINEQIDRMRHSATQALLERRCYYCSSVSCIYGIGSVETYVLCARFESRNKLRYENNCFYLSGTTV